jgi:hypothetical protein
MASIQRTISIHCSAEHAWAALRDFGAVHLRLAPGFVTDARMDTPTSRVVTFADGRSARELLVSCDDATRRLVYSIVGGRPTHHNASAQIFAESDGSCRFVWSADLLPDELGPAFDAMMTRGAAVMRETLEASA